MGRVALRGASGVRTMPGVAKGNAESHFRHAAFDLYISLCRQYSTMPGRVYDSAHYRPENQ